MSFLAAPSSLRGCRAQDGPSRWGRVCSSSPRGSENAAVLLVPTKRLCSVPLLPKALRTCVFLSSLVASGRLPPTNGLGATSLGEAARPHPVVLEVPARSRLLGRAGPGVPRTAQAAAGGWGRARPARTRIQAHSTRSGWSSFPLGFPSTPVAPRGRGYPQMYGSRNEGTLNHTPSLLAASLWVLLPSLSVSRPLVAVFCRTCLPSKPSSNVLSPFVRKRPRQAFQREPRDDLRRMPPLKEPGPAISRRSPAGPPGRPGRVCESTRTAGPNNGRGALRPPPARHRNTERPHVSDCAAMPAPGGKCRSHVRGARHFVFSIPGPSGRRGWGRKAGIP